MSKDEFENQLRRDGYLEIKHRCFEGSVDSQTHCHDFDTRLLVEEGELTIVIGDARRSVRVTPPSPRTAAPPLSTSPALAPRRRRSLAVSKP